MSLCGLRSLDHIKIWRNNEVYKYLWYRVLPRYLISCQQKLLCHIFDIVLYHYQTKSARGEYLPRPQKKRTAEIRCAFPLCLSVSPRVRRKGGCLPCRSDCREAAVRREWVSCRNGCRRSSQKYRRGWNSRCHTGCYCCCRCSGWSPPGSAGRRGRHPRSAPR